MKSRSVFEFSSYKTFMKYVLRRAGARGALSRAAEALNCQRSYLSRIMDSEIHITLDHAFLLGLHFKFPKVEHEYFRTMVEHERASDRSYREHLNVRLHELRKEHESISERMNRPPPNTFGGQEIVYFSAWQWTAIHFLLACPKLQSTDAIADRLGISSAAVLHFLGQLSSWGLVRQDGSKWIYAGGAFHLPKDSPIVIQHHQNWRARAILDAQIPGSGGLHYTNVQTVAKSDLPTLNELMLKFIGDCKEILDPSPEEDVVAITCDVFRV